MANENDTEKDSESEVEEKSEATELQDSSESVEAKLTRLERENKRLYRKLGQLETQTKIEPKEIKKSDESVLKRLDALALKMAGIEADDEKELFQRWKEQTGREADEITGNKIFQAELADIRTAKSNAAATDVKVGDGKDSGVKSDPSYWLAKATKNSEGGLMFPDDMPNDIDLRAGIVERMGDDSKPKGEFYNQGRQ